MRLMFSFRLAITQFGYDQPSVFVIHFTQGPRCSIRSKKMYGDLVPDAARLLILYVPAVMLVLGFVFAIDDITGFEITTLVELPPPVRGRIPVPFLFS